MAESTSFQERRSLARLHSSGAAILPSLLLCDFGNLEAEVRKLEAAQVPALHLDVMDGHFVPNLSYGLPLVEAIRGLTELPLDVHLMISNPEQMAEKYVAAGADSVTVHIEACDQPRSLLDRLRAAGAETALALNPPTPVAAVEPPVDACDMILVMSVMPGFGGQAFDPVALEKLHRLRTLAGDSFVLEVDGGINQQTIPACAQAGANFFVVGSAIFHSSDYRQRVQQLKQLAQGQ